MKILLKDYPHTSGPYSRWPRDVDWPWPRPCFRFQCFCSYMSGMWLDRYLFCNYYLWNCLQSGGRCNLSFSDLIKQSLNCTFGVNNHSIVKLYLIIFFLTPHRFLIVLKSCPLWVVISVFRKIVNLKNQNFNDNRSRYLESAHSNEKNNLQNRFSSDGKNGEHHRNLNKQTLSEVIIHKTCIHIVELLTSPFFKVCWNDNVQWKYRNRSSYKI